MVLDKQPRALIVDDSRVARAMIARALDGAYEIEQADCAEAGLETLASSEAFAVLIVDWNIPGMSGVEFVRELRKSGKHPDLKILMITTEVEGDSVGIALDAGVDEYLMKPFVTASVLEKLAILELPVEKARA